LITLHLGNGCSACAIRGGQSHDTSMGFTPLEGLIMGTRSGDVDPAVIDFLGYKEGLTSGEVETLLNKQSGLLGISGMTSDMRELLEEEADTGDRRVVLAITMFCQRVRKCIGGYYAEMGGADAIVFAGGVGENSPRIRELVCQGLECLGLELDPELNSRTVGGEAARISTPESRLEAWVIPTDEELLIARDTARLVQAGARM
jgi:acetate kinase